MENPRVRSRCLGFRDFLEREGRLLSLLSGVISPHAIFSEAWSVERSRQCLM